MHVLIIDISPNSYEKMSSAGYKVMKDNAWSYEKRKDKYFQSLLKTLGVDLSEANFDKLQIEPTSSEDREMIDSSIEQISVYLTEKRIHDSVFVVFNLMPFELRPAFFDKVTEKIRDKCMRSLKIQTVLFLIRSISLLSTLDNSARSRKVIPIELLALDFSGHCYRYKRNHLEKKQLPIEIFGDILNIEYNTIYHSLVFETNHIIGHFKLTNTHVRTHYNLNDFIKRDSVWIYIYRIIKNMIGDEEKVFLIGTGLENRVVNYICTQISDTLGKERVQFIIPSKPSELDHDWSSKYDKAIVITDIICSGKTVEEWLEQLISQNYMGKQIHVFCVAHMENTEVPIRNINVKPAAVIKRTYYDKDDCLLCRIKQPFVTVNKTEDFSAMLSKPLTPYDFWEVVADTQALITEDQDVQGRNFPYRIDTARVITRYKSWLINIIKERYKKNWSAKKATVLCVVNEEGSKMFAELVSQALKIERIVKLNRSSLNRVTASSGLPVGEESPFDDKDNVLVVDDGINHGITISKMIDYCCAAGCMPMGAIVFDNRLHEDALKKIRMAMGNNHIVDLYTWPTLKAKE